LRSQSTYEYPRCFPHLVTTHSAHIRASSPLLRSIDVSCVYDDTRLRLAPGGASAVTESNSICRRQNCCQVQSCCRRASGAESASRLYTLLQDVLIRLVGEIAIWILGLRNGEMSRRPYNNVMERNRRRENAKNNNELKLQQRHTRMSRYEGL